MKKIFLLLLLPYMSNAQQRIVTSVAGEYVGGGIGFIADGIPAKSALFVGTSGVAIDESGNVYIGDKGFNRVRIVDAVSGLVYTIAGSALGFSGDGGPATSAYLNTPSSICVDRSNNVYIDDSGNHRIRKINPAGIINTVAGGGASTADGIPATSASIGSANYIAVDTSGILYIADSAGRVRKVDPATGFISTITGINANCLQTDIAGNLYFSWAGLIQKRDAGTGIITTLAGGGTSIADDVPATTANLIGNKFCIDAAGNIYLGTGTLVREVNVTTGNIYTIAGCGGDYDEGIPAIDAYAANFMFCTDSTGNIYYSNDASNVREISNFYPSYSLLDSFNVSINNYCAGAQISISTNHYTPGLSIKAYFGDGQSTTVAVVDGCTSAGGYVVINHAYNYSGTYTLKFVLYSGSTALDSLHMSYAYVLCNSIPLGFYFDTDSNCIKDNAEPFLFLPVLTEVDSNGVTVDTISATSGLYYNAYGSVGTIYSFKEVSLPAGLHISCPSSGIIYDTIKPIVYNTQINYFGVQCSTPSAFDLEINAVVPVTGINDQWGNIYLSNNYCESDTPIDATVTLYFSAKYGSPLGNPAPVSVTSNTITWNVTGLTANATSPVNLYYAIWANPVTGPLIVGDTVQSYFTITPTSGDVAPSNNVEIIIDTVRAGCDPNNMSVIPNDCIATGAVTPLQYTISFVNTGNDTAFNIYIMDTLPASVDIKTMKIITSSAKMFVSQLPGNILKFDFPGINLLDSSAYPNRCSGAVIFTVNTLPGLAKGTVLPSDAGIYFDDNPVVVTNTVQNIVGCDLGIATISNKNDIRIYPNPATTQLTIQSTNQPINEVTVNNLVGQTVYSNRYNSPQIEVDISFLPAGVYFVKVNGSEVRKFVKE